MARLVAAELIGVETQGLQGKVTRFGEELRARFVERDEVIEGCLLAALAGEHVLLLGPPGTAKSALARELANGFAGSYFEWLLSKFSAPEELFGPISLAGLKADRYVRITTGKLPEAQVCFLDEIFKANSGVLNALLSAVNERVFHDGAGARPIPLRMVIGASNELPEGPELGALYDRFLVRYWVGYTSSSAAFGEMLFGQSGPLGVQLTIEEWDRARAEVAAVKVAPDLAGVLWSVRTELEKLGIKLSDRRLKRALGLARASAWLSEETEVTEEHLAILAHVLWSEPGERAAVAEAVTKVSAGVTLEALKIQDTALQLIASLPVMKKPVSKDDQDKLVAANRDGTRALGQLEDLQKKAKNGRQKAVVAAALKRIVTALVPVRHAAREALGL